MEKKAGEDVREIKKEDIRYIGEKKLTVIDALELIEEYCIEHGEHIVNIVVNRNVVSQYNGKDGIDDVYNDCLVRNYSIGNYYPVWETATVKTDKAISLYI